MTGTKLVSKRNIALRTIGNYSRAIAILCDENDIMAWDVPDDEYLDCRAIEREIKKLEEILATMKQAQKKLNKLLEE